MDAVAEQVFAAVGSLGVRFGREWSVKIDAQAVSTNRFLLGLRKPRIAGDPDARLLEACVSLGMPPSVLIRYRSELPSAQYVHFGYESSDGVSWAKAYLEFFEEVDGQLRSGAPRQPRYLVHRGFKWVPSAESPAQVTSYWWHPQLSSSQMLTKLEDVLSSDGGDKLRSVTAGLLDMAMRRTSPQNLHFLEVVEAGNERRSFDINFYRAHLSMADVRAAFEAACAVHGQSYKPWEGRWPGIAAERFGHLAGGVDRSGRSFMTFYFGMTYFEAMGDRVP